MHLLLSDFIFDGFEDIFVLYMFATFLYFSYILQLFVKSLNLLNTFILLGHVFLIKKVNKGIYEVRKCLFFK